MMLNHRPYSLLIILLILFSSKSTFDLKVTAGQLSLVDKETTEQILSVYSVTPVDVYNSTGQLNDIALVRVSLTEHFNCILLIIIIFCIFLNRLLQISI